LNDLIIVGEFKNNLPNGYARVTYSDKSEYEGELNNGLRHGKGLYKYSSNDPFVQYEGVFVEDEYGGMGELIFKNKSKYVGDFKSNLFHGQGEYTTADFIYVGEFKMGRIEGRGIMKFKNGEYYDG
jgi:hypothetical protein